LPRRRHRRKASRPVTRKRSLAMEAIIAIVVFLAAMVALNYIEFGRVD
jgi:hypothetical protein